MDIVHVHVHLNPILKIFYKIFLRFFFLKEYEIHPIEIQYGLFNLTEALQFLHSGVKLMHGNITPEVVMVTAGGAWKLMGLNFCCFSNYQSETTVCCGGGREGGREGGRKKGKGGEGGMRGGGERGKERGEGVKERERKNTL